jgi:glucosylceramidase
MKDNEATSGGHLDPVYYKAYARYLVKYIRAMKAAGIPIAAITPQNEPMNPRNNPSMVMTDTAEANFVGTALGPAFRAAGCAAKIIVWDHNCDLPEYPLYILRDAKAARYVDGSAFHLYRGEISAMSKVHHAFPEKRLYFTEEYTAGGSDFGGDLSWHIANLIIGAPRNWARNVLEWNLAADSLLEPHTPGGCSTCMGALTIGDSVTRNVSYYIIAHASRFVRPGSVRVASTVNADLPNVAFQTPDGRKVLIVLNQAGDNRTFHISFKGRQATTSLMAGAVATYVW